MKEVRVSEELQKKYPKQRPPWLRKVVGAKTKIIEASYDPVKEWKQDEKGYYIIKIFYDEGYFGARFCTNDHVPRIDVVGNNGLDIFQTIVREGLVGSMQHAAYLGHELHKAEVAMKLRLNFVQDAPLDYSKKTKKKESDNLPE